MNIIVNSCIVKENLPFPFVHYPNHYGTFFCFSKEENSTPYFCLCNKSAIENYLKTNPDRNNTQMLRWAPLDNFHFPDTISRKSIETNLLDSILKYKKELCHRCNLSVPEKNYCHPMYGGKFKQKYGWYINQNYYRIGIPPRSNIIIDENIPSDLKQKVLELEKLHEQIEDLQNLSYEEKVLHEKQCNKTARFIENYIENLTRKEFGIRKIGERWISETILYNIVKKLFPDEEMIRHYRPIWLENLELDIFLPGKNLAFEYQGQQHYHPIKAWGGEAALEALKIRDQRKTKLCKKEAVTLIHVKYTEPLNAENILSLIKKGTLRKL